MERKWLILLTAWMLVCFCVSLFPGCSVWVNEKGEIGVIIKEKESSPDTASSAPDSGEFTLEEKTVVYEKRVTGPLRKKRSSSNNERVSENTADPDERIRSFYENAGLGTDIWIIEKSSSSEKENQIIASPELMAVLPEGKKEVGLPLESTRVDARISGYIATVDVFQKYHNPYADKIEAVYTFPLHQNAAVTDFMMVVGDRKIRGLVREKAEAERIYQEAKARGYRASLLTQERPNIFRQRVANIEPGKRIDISITYFNPLEYRDGEYEFVFPAVVGPRFNPPGHTDGVGAVSKDPHIKSGEATDITYFNPNEGSGHRISIHVDIDAGVSIENIYSRTHVITIDKTTASRAVVTNSTRDSIPNKDFVLRYKTSGDGIKTAMMVHKGSECGFFSLFLHPPENFQNMARIPREMVFVLDCSGSMSGTPLSIARKATERALRNLDAGDTFQIIRFSAEASSLGPTPVPATPGNVEKGIRYLYSLRSDGGTMMIDGVKAALDFPHDASRLRIVSFMTDGYIGNEAEILAAIDKKLGASRIFSFGIGSSVNRYLLERMAVMGRGAVAYVGLDESAGEVVDQFYETATRPAMTNIEIDWGGLEIEDVYPGKIPDLFAGRPIMITGRLMNKSAGKVRVRGQVGGNTTYFDIPVDPGGSDINHPGIQSVWARCKLAELSNREIYDPSDRIKKEIIATSIHSNLISRYTAFLAVDSLEPTKGAHGYTVDIPVPLPDGIKYETTVENKFGPVRETQ